MAIKRKLSDSELSVAIQNKDAEAFNYLYKHYSAALYGVINTHISDEGIASDILQDVFVNIWLKNASYNSSKGRFFTWMLNIARNAAIDMVRQKNYRKRLNTYELLNEMPIDGQVLLPNFDHIGLKKAIKTLNQKHRTAIQLYFFQGYKHEEMAKITGLPLGTVKTHIRQALIELKRCWSEDNEVIRERLVA